jgi:hypothetical protein
LIHRINQTHEAVRDRAPIFVYRLCVFCYSSTAIIEKADPARPTTRLRAWCCMQSKQAEKPPAERWCDVDRNSDYQERTSNRHRFGAHVGSPPPLRQRL